MKHEIHNLCSADIRPILALNNLHAQATSLLDREGLARLLRIACYARGTHHGTTALLIALDQDAPYDNPNFCWFKERYQQFVYVDRIIVSGSLHGQGVGRLLYQDLFAWAIASGQSQVVCEVNSRPPNPASDAFHSALGFVEVGQAEIHNGTKSVRYLQRLLQ